MEQLLKQVKPCNFSSYENYIQRLITEGIARYNSTCDQINYKLFEINKAIYQDLSKNAITLVGDLYVDGRIPEKCYRLNGLVKT